MYDENIDGLGFGLPRVFKNIKRKVYGKGGVLIRSSGKAPDMSRSGELLIGRGSPRGNAIAVRLKKGQIATALRRGAVGIPIKRVVKDTTIAARINKIESQLRVLSRLKTPPKDAVKKEIKLTEAKCQLQKEKVENKIEAFKEAEQSTREVADVMNEEIAKESPQVLIRPRQNFVNWVQKDNPELLRKIAVRISGPGRWRTIAAPGGRVVQMKGLGAAVIPIVTTTKESTPSIWETIWSGAQKLIPTLIGAKQQRDLYNLNLERAKKGLNPLDAGAIAPVIKTQFEIGPETRQELMTGAGMQLEKYMIPLGIGALAIAAMFVMKK